MVAIQKYMSATDAAKILGCSRSTVCRAAKNYEIGIFANGRLTAINATDLSAIRERVRKTPGNPNWIAARGRKRRNSAKPKTGF